MMRCVALVVLPMAFLSCIGTGYVASINPGAMAFLQQGMPRHEVRKVLGRPASTGMSEFGEETWEYRELRWDFGKSQRELAAVYHLRFRSGRLQSWNKVEGATYRPPTPGGGHNPGPAIAVVTVLVVLSLLMVGM